MLPPFQVNKTQCQPDFCRPAAVWPVPRQRAARPGCCECPCSARCVGVGATWEMENQTEEPDGSK